MSLERTLNDLEKHLDYASSYFKDVRQEIEELENDYFDEIYELKKELDTLGKQNELLGEQVQDLTSENIELKSEIIQYLNLIKMLKDNVDI